MMKRTIKNMQFIFWKYSERNQWNCRSTPTKSSGVYWSPKTIFLRAPTEYCMISTPYWFWSIQFLRYFRGSLIGYSMTEEPNSTSLSLDSRWSSPPLSTSWPRLLTSTVHQSRRSIAETTKPNLTMPRTDSGRLCTQQSITIVVREAPHHLRSARCMNEELRLVIA